MNQYDTLLMEAEKGAYIVKEAPLGGGYLGRIKGNRIAIEQRLRTDEKACTLAEELGHGLLTVGNIIDQADDANRQQERRARLWAYNTMIGLQGIIDCFKRGCRNRYEMAEHLGVTEDFLADTLELYRQKYGTHARIGNYIIYFEPNLSVMELI